MRIISNSLVDQEAEFKRVRAILLNRAMADKSLLMGFAIYGPMAADKFNEWLDEQTRRELSKPNEAS
jgi:hypothetical protein